jgi:hypothetical protein
LLHLDHAQVALGLIVIEWHFQIVRESQHFIALFVHSREQVVCLALLGPTAFSRCLRQLRMGFESFGNPPVSIGEQCGDVEISHAALHAVAVLDGALTSTGNGAVIHFAQAGQRSGGMDGMSEA